MQTAIVVAIVCLAAVWLVLLLTRQVRRARSGKGCGCCSARGSCARAGGADTGDAGGECEEWTEGRK